MTYWVDEIKGGDEVLLCYCSLVLNRLVRLVPRELVAHALISCLRKVSAVNLPFRSEGRAN